VGTALLLVGVFTGAGHAADKGAQEWDLTLAYECTLPSGQHEAQVRVSGKLPGKVSPGEQVRATDVGLKIALPASGLVSADAAAQTVAGSAGLDVAVAQPGSGGKPAEAEWTGLGIQATELPAEGDVELEATGEVPWVTPPSAGDLTFTAGDLSLQLETQADGSDPASLDVQCTFAPDQAATLATGAVGATHSSPTSESPSAQPPKEDRTPSGSDVVKPMAASTGQDPGAGCKVTNSIDISSQSVDGYGYMAGYANVNKLNGAIFLKDPARLVHMTLAERLDFLQCPPSEMQANSRLVSTGQLDYRGKSQFPPQKATFLTFGFVPTTATVELSLEGPISISAYPMRRNGMPLDKVVVDSKVRIRVYDVKVNGEKLDVGSSCRTVRPMEQRLFGEGGQGPDGPFGYTIQLGGPLTGTSTVPPVRGCADGLDKLFTASLSGPGNFTKLTQAPLCVDREGSTNQKFCPKPPLPKPER
jgi:hypothetical protein